MKKFLVVTAIALIAIIAFAGYSSAAITQHLSITSYNGPSTCTACHTNAAKEMLATIHMKWAGPTPNVTNGGGAILGKGVKGINTFCTYAMSSKAACFNCHVRSDGNAPHAPAAADVDCLMCHNDTYQRKFVTDPNGLTVTNVLGQTKTYYFGAQDANGNYSTVPDYALMPAGTTLVSLAQNVHRPTKKSCLRCHAKAGGGDWTKRGDMGVNSAAPTVDQDVHMSASGANLSCTSCHKATAHKMGGRGIDLRATEAPNPTCTQCHPASPHPSTVANYTKLNRHANQGRVACQVCHIRTFGKGGATEMSRDWRTPVWNAGFCNGQGGFVGEEVKVANVKPDYTWFNGTSYVYNVGETITPNAQGVYTMAKANGVAFGLNSKIVPIKRHTSVMPLHTSGQIIAPMISWMFMTGYFDDAVQKGMAEQGLTGGYALVPVDAEMLITHGVDPKTKAPTCTECHNQSGTTADGGSYMVPFDKLGYHVWPAKVKACTLCHSAKTASWESMHNRHARDGESEGTAAQACTNCHTKEPIGLVKPQSDLCNDCHSLKTWRGATTHMTHVKRGKVCTTCHKF